MQSNSSVEGLYQVLADSYALYLNTQACHWNVTGASFAGLHSLFEQQYNELAAAVDELAERIRTLGVVINASLKAFAEKSSLPAIAPDIPARQMLEHLQANHQFVLKSLRDALKAAQAAEDVASEDLLTQRIAWHEKTIWMLQAHF